jgi:hypothetical protein
MKTMRHGAPTELTIHARELRELFSEREFDPFVDDADALSSIAQVARFPNVTSSLEKMRLRVFVTLGGGVAANANARRTGDCPILFA